MDDQRPRKSDRYFDSVTIRAGHSMFVISRIWWLIRHASSHPMLPVWRRVSTGLPLRSGSGWLCRSMCSRSGGVVHRHKYRGLIGRCILALEGKL